MAKLENNNDKENKKSVTDNLEDAVQKGVENVQETVKEAAELAGDAIKHPVETSKEFVEQAAKDVVSVKWWAKLLQVLFWSVLILVTVFIILINLPATKNWAAQKVISKLNGNLKSQITFDSIDVNYFGDVSIYQVVAKDYKNYPFLKAKKIYADSNWFSIIFDQRKLQFQSLALEKMDLQVITYKGDSISNFIRFVNLFDSGKKPTSNKPFELKTRISIQDSKLSIINQNSEGDKGKWLQATGLQLVVPELRIKGGDIFAQINNLRFTTERFGKKHFIETFSTNLTLNKKFLSLSDLTFNTDNSLLQGDIKFNLNNGKWTDFTNKVRWEMQLKSGSQLSGYDISYFVTNWDQYDPVRISGKMTGPLNKFYLENFALGNPNLNIRTDLLKAENLLNGNFLIETSKLSTDFTYRDLKAMLPSFISEKLKNFADDFGRLKYNGAAKVTPNQVFIPNGDLITGIGQAQITNFYLEDFSTSLPKFRGLVDVTNLNAATITKNKQVGLISGRFNLDGQSFDVNTMVLKTRSDISKIQILGKEINNVFLDGILDHKTYKGIVNINDEMAKGNLKGFIDFRTKKLSADLDADINMVNLSYFTGQKSTQIFSGKLKGKIAMSNINDMNLDLSLQNAAFTNGSQQYLVNSGNIKAYFDNGNRIISAKIPGIVDGQITGKYNIGDLGGMIQNGIGKILVGAPSLKLYKGQRFNADFIVEQGLVNYFMPEIRLNGPVSVNAGFGGDSNNMVLNLQSAGLQYLMKNKNIADTQKKLDDAGVEIDLTGKKSSDTAYVDNIMLRLDTKNLNEQFFAKIDRVKLGENIFKEIQLSGRNETGQLLHLYTNFLHGNPTEEKEDHMKSYAVNLNQSTDNAGNYVFRFEPTEVNFNNITWKIDTSESLDHSITYRKNAKDFLIKNLRIFSDDSELLINNATFANADAFAVDATVHNFQISKLLAFKSSDNTITGLANGNIQIEKNKNNLEPKIDLQVDDIQMNDKKLGNLKINAKPSDRPNVFDIEGKIVSGDFLGDTQLNLTGTIDNNTKSPTLALTAALNDFDLGFTETFIGAVFSNIRGKATGDLLISGTMDNVDYSGDIALKGFGLKLNFTGVDYAFDDTVIPLSKGLAVMNEIGVKDGRSNSHGTISGAIQFETLASMGVNLVLRADNLLLLNTKQKDFDLFWGTIYGEGDLYVDGAVSALSISTPNMRALNNSVFTFNSNSANGVEEYKMLRFLKEDNTGNITIEDKQRSGANMNMDFTINVDKGTTVNVLVGDEIGDITVRGDADNLRFVMSRKGTISLNGDYIVDNGTFISKAVLQRKFQIEKGSSISWDGDAMSPELNIAANYLRTVTNAGQYLNMNNLPPLNVKLTTKITQKLTDPLIVLDVSAQDVSSQVRDALTQKMNNQDEKVIQFGSILVLSSFNVNNSGLKLDIGNTLEDATYNLAFKQLGSVLNTISNEFQFDLDYLSDNSGNNSDRANASLRFALSPRLSVKTGMGIPISKASNANQDYLSGEGIIEYDFSKNNDGSKVFRAYSKPSNIGLATGLQGNNNAANQSYGVGIVYSKSFNRLFKKKDKIKNQDSLKRENFSDSTRIKSKK